MNLAQADALSRLQHSTTTALNVHCFVHLLALLQMTAQLSTARSSAHKVLALPYSSKLLLQS